MNDQAWAAVVGLAAVIVLRVLDFYFPRGYTSKGIRKRAVKLEEIDDTESELEQIIDSEEVDAAPSRKRRSRPPATRKRRSSDSDKETGKKEDEE